MTVEKKDCSPRCWRDLCLDPRRQGLRISRGLEGGFGCHGRQAAGYSAPSSGNFKAYRIGDIAARAGHSRSERQRGCSRSWGAFQQKVKDWGLKETSCFSGERRRSSCRATSRREDEGKFSSRRGSCRQESRSAMGASRSLAAERCLVQKRERPAGRKTNEATGSAGLVRSNVIGHGRIHAGRSGGS
jgi:hypothetical protein